MKLGAMKPALKIVAIFLGLGLLPLRNLSAVERESFDIGMRPESVTEGFGGDFFISVMMEQNSGDGVIKRWDGKSSRVFCTGLDEPKGICFTGDFLVVTDLKRVWKIDGSGRKSILAGPEDFPALVLYLNDAAAAPDGKSVYVTDMGANDKMFGPEGLWPLESIEAKAIPALGRVYRISMDGKVTTEIDVSPSMLNPNGVCVGNDGQLLVCEFFKGNLLSWNHQSIELLGTGYRGADAIVQAADGSIYLSSWTQGKVWKLDAKADNPRVLVDGLESAADFYLDEERSRLIIPDMLAGKLYVIPRD